MLNTISVGSSLNGLREVRLEGFRSVFYLEPLPDGFCVRDPNGALIVSGPSITETLLRLSSLLCDMENPDLDTFIEFQKDY